MEVNIKHSIYEAKVASRDSVKKLKRYFEDFLFSTGLDCIFSFSMWNSIFRTGISNYLTENKTVTGKLR